MWCGWLLTVNRVLENGRATLNLPVFDRPLSSGAMWDPLPRADSAGTAGT